MRKPSTKSSKPQLLPSLLDRVTDDNYINVTLETSRQKVIEIEKKLSKADSEVSAKQKKEWIDELKTQRGQLDYLQRSIGTLNKVSDCVKRDLTWLFNSSNMCQDELLGEKYKEVESSVLNYGLPDLTGKTASSINVLELEETLKQTIIRFETRIIPDTLQVTLQEDEESIEHNSLIFEISGDIWTDPIPVHMHLRTQMNLESGNVEVKDL